MNGRDQPLFPKSGKDPERKRNGEQLTRRDGQHRLAVLDSGRETPFRIIPELLVHAQADFLRQEGTAPPRPSAPVGQVDESPEHAVPQKGEVDRKVRPGRSARGSGVEKVARGRMSGPAASSSPLPPIRIFPTPVARRSTMSSRIGRKNRRTNSASSDSPAYRYPARANHSGPSAQNVPLPPGRRGKGSLECARPP